MGDINTLKNILLFAVKNDCKEIQLSNGNLPLLVKNDGNIKYLNGILPVSGNLMEEIRKRYITEHPNVIVSVAEQEFLLMSMGDSLVFRYLPVATPADNIDKALSSACYSNRGMILITSKIQEIRFLNSYRVASSTVTSRKITMVVVEKNKLFSIRNSGSNIINIYRPNTDLDSLVRVADQVSSDCLFIPDCTEESIVPAVENISHGKLVILGTTPQIAKEVDRSNVLYLLSVSEDGTVSNKTDPGLRINRDVIIKNLRGYNHA